MIRSIIFFSLLFLGSIIAHAQEYYYWAEGEKHSLELYPDKQYILMQGQNKKAIALELELSEQSISELKPINISSTINTDRASKSLENDQYWAFVNSSIDKAKVPSSDIIYVAPLFLVNGKEIGLSHYFYVKLKQEKDIEVLESLAKENLVEIVGNDSFMPLWYILSCDKNSKGNALEMANLFYESGYFDSAEPDLMGEFSMGCTNDPLFAEQWHLNNTGQAGGTVGNDIKACQAWNITTGCANVVVAVLDQGLEFNHPDFNNISPISFDTENGRAPSVDRGIHGVPVAGVIGATQNNTLGVSGVSPEVQLMSISNDLEPAPLLSQRLANGINFAWQNEAAIINNSWGSNSIEQQGLINDAINNAVTQGRGGLGTIVVCITHNQSASSIAFPSNNPQTIAVGAINRTQSRASFSNYGAGIDVVAPGVSISTTDWQGALGYNQTAGPNGDYTSLDGTSFAAPQVAGIAALILSVNPGLTQQEVRNIIESTADKVGGYTYTLGAGEQATLTWNSEMGYGRVNAHAAVQAALPTISGPDYLCSTNTFTLQNVPAGSTVNWLAEPGSLFSNNPPSGSGTSAPLSPNSSFASGQATVTFTIETPCGEMEVKKSFWVGTPSFTSPTVDGNPYIIGSCHGVCPGFHQAEVTIGGLTNAMPPDVNWQLSGGPVSWSWDHFTGRITFEVQPMTSFPFSFNGTATNPCGSTPFTFCFISGPNCPMGSYSLSPNPADGEVVVTNQAATKEDTDLAVEILIISHSFETVYSMTAKGKKIRVPTGQFPNGQYVLQISDKNGVYRKHLIIRH